MKNPKFIFLLFLFSLSLGQEVLGLSLHHSVSEESQIQPVEAPHNKHAYPPASGYLMEAETKVESLFRTLNRLNTGFSESSQEEDDKRDWVRERLEKRKKCVWLFSAAVIERSLTFRELIYPHHFYF